MINNILLVLLTILGFRVNGPKVDLHRKPTHEDYRKKLNYWASRNIGIIGVAVIIGLLVFFILFCFWVVGVSATDSGMLYNNFDKVI